MTKQYVPDDGRLADLLTSKATEGLEAAEQLELRCLLAADPTVEEDGLDLAAALIDQALIPTDSGVSLSADLEASLKGMAQDFASAPVPVAESTSAPADGSSLRGWAISGWVAAAAAVILLFAGLDLSGDGGAPGGVNPVAELSAAERSANLEAQATDLVRAEWKGVEGQDDFQAVTGRVTFSPNRQEGYMHLTGLPRNDASKQQYQLWIVDPSRDKEPVDGGVFDIDVADGEEAIVPIRAALRVDGPTTFVITLEQKGGVVVSEGPFRVIAAPE